MSPSWSGTRDYGESLTHHTLRAISTISSEICYRIQYPVRNNRNRGDAFSLRQVGVCYKSSELDCSTWMIFQPSSEILEIIESTLSDEGQHPQQSEDLLQLHTTVLSLHSANWDDYIDYLRANLEQFVSGN